MPVFGAFGADLNGYHGHGHGGVYPAVCNRRQNDLTVVKKDKAAVTCNVKKR
jgi:hypothetical protein